MCLDLRWLDVAFDILYFGDTSVIHQSLKERHEILCKVVRPMKGRLEILVPNAGINSHLTSGKIVLTNNLSCLVCFWGISLQPFTSIQLSRWHQHF